MSSLLTLQISIKHAVSHRFASHLHADDLMPQCTQFLKRRLLVLDFLPVLPLNCTEKSRLLGWNSALTVVHSLTSLCLCFPGCELKETN